MRVQAIVQQAASYAGGASYDWAITTGQTDQQVRSEFMNQSSRMHDPVAECCRISFVP